MTDDDIRDHIKKIHARLKAWEARYLRFELDPDCRKTKPSVIFRSCAEALEPLIQERAKLQERVKRVAN